MRERLTGQRSRWEANLTSPWVSWGQTVTEQSTENPLRRNAFRISGFRIDLLVKGLKGRLGVECDGDLWHGPDRYDDDMARQRMLERCCLSFWRVRESSFYREPDAALEGLWESLGRLGINPTP